MPFRLCDCLPVADHLLPDYPACCQTIACLFGDLFVIHLTLFVAKLHIHVLSVVQLVPLALKHY